MADIGDKAPDFTAPLATGDVRSFTLSEHLEEAPIVLAFFPAAFTETCTTELCTFQGRMANFDDVGATVYGVSVDLPFALNEFRDQEALSFGIVSDSARDVVDAYDVRTNMENSGVRGVAKRAVFVIDEGGTITYSWVSDDLGREPNYDEVAAAVEAAA